MTTAKRETEWERRKRRDRERQAHVALHGPGCELCGAVPKVGLHEDHNHRTGKHRGWLCHRCNRALPSWVTADWLLAAAAYLRRNAPCTCPPNRDANTAMSPNPHCERHGYTLV